MKTVTATILARKLKSILDEVEYRGESISIIRGGRSIAKIIANPALMTAMEAMGDLYRTIPEAAAKDWEKEGKSIYSKLSHRIKDPWAS